MFSYTNQKRLPNSTTSYLFVVQRGLICSALPKKTERNQIYKGMRKHLDVTKIFKTLPYLTFKVRVMKSLSPYG